MLRDRNIIYGQSQIIGNPRPHHGVIITLVAYSNLIACHNPKFALDPPLFDAPKLTKYLEDHETLSASCHLGCHVDFSIILLILALSVLVI